jgi:hypothetical protein
MMKIEPWHYPDVDTVTYNWWCDMTECGEDDADERLVRIYWTYKAWRDAKNYGNLSFAEWQYIILRLGLMKKPMQLASTISDDLRAMLAVGDGKLNEEYEQRVIVEAVFQEATKHTAGSGRAMRRMEYEAAMMGLYPLPNHVINTLAEAKERYDDIQDMHAEQAKEHKKNKSKVQPPQYADPGDEPEVNGKMQAVDVPDHYINQPVRIEYFAPKTGTQMLTGTFIGREGQRIVFQPDDGSKARKLKVVKIVG